MKVTVIYWRDIPSQVAAKAGRKSAKVMLGDRFQEAIDMAAMRDKAHESDAYLEGWKKGEPVNVEGDMQVVAADKAAEIERAFDEELLRAFVKNGGWRPE
ncbi:MAG: virulence factor [Sneathiella sp.]|nr:virulence factor [Sneathiella sp.]